MTTFKEIEIDKMFCLVGCLGKSHWLKINEHRAICISTDNGRFELNQEKPFVPSQKVYRFPNN